MNLLRYIKRLINGEKSNMWLTKRGCIIGHSFNRGSGCFIDPEHCYLINIGNHVTFSINVVVLSHDASTSKLIGYVKLGKVVINDNVFVGANSIILPGVEIGENSIIGSGSVVTKDVPKNTIFAGNPARFICTVDEYKLKHEKILNSSSTFSKDYSMRNRPTEDMIKEIVYKTKKGVITYIK